MDLRLVFNWTSIVGQKFADFDPQDCQSTGIFKSVEISSLQGGLVASGRGYCMDDTGRKIDLMPGMVWAIPKDTVHSFHTDQSLEELNVIAYHPDTDWGPVDESLGGKS